MSRDFLSLPGDLRQPQHRALVDHWLDLYRAGNGRIPAVQEIDALRLGRHLPDICILDHEGGDVFRFRIAGGNVNEFYGQDVARRDMTTIVESPTRERLLGMAHAILGRPAAILHGLSSMMPQWNYSLALQRISLPLAGADGDLRHIISANAYFRYERSAAQMQSGVAAVDAEFQHDYRIPTGAEAEALLAAERASARSAG